MQKHSLQVNISHPDSKYVITIGDELLAGCGQWARVCLGNDAARVAVISDSRVSPLYADQVSDSLKKAGFVVSHFVVNAGERSKNLKTIDRALEHLSGSGITRTDAVVALGGGVVGDIAGFAAAVHLRGVQF